MQQGTPLGAIVLLNNALEKDPNYVEARYQLGLAYLISGKFDQAEKELSKVRRQAPAMQEVRLDLAQLYLATQRVDEAAAEVDQFEQGNPPTSISREYQGRIFAVRNDVAQAEQAFREAMELDAQNVSARLALAQVYLRLRWDGEARALLNATIKAFPKNKGAYYMLAALEGSQGKKEQALQAYQQITAIDPNDVGALYMTGMLYLDIGKQEQAQQIADKLLTRFPKHPAGSRLKGMLFYVQGNYENATIELRKSLQSMNDIGGHYFLGLAEYRAGRYELALSQFQAALDLQPSHAQSRLMVAMTLLQQKRLEDSINQASRVLREDEQNAMAHNVLGSAYLAKGEYDKAMEHLDRAVALDPSLADVYMKKGLFNLSQGDRAEAEIELNRAVEAAPEVLNTRFLLVSLYLRQQNYAGAIETLQAGLTGTAEDALLYNYMAAAYFAQKKPEEAVQALVKAKAAKMDYLTPYFNLANYYISAGKRQEAIEEYRAILKIDPQQIKALISLASLHEIMGDSVAAKSDYEKARATETIDGYLALAGYLLRSGEKAKMTEVVDAAYAAHAESLAVLELRGKLKLERDNLAEAVKMFEAMDKVKPGTGLPLLVAAWLQAGEKDRAIALAQEQIDGHPDAPGGYLLMAAIHRELQQLDQAEADLNQGMAKAPNAPVLSLQLAQLYAVTQRTEQAIATLNDLLKSQPNFVPGIYALGTLYDQVGNKRRAVELYKEVLAQSENHTAALNNLSYLYADNYDNSQEALALAVKAFRNEPANPGIMDTLGYALLKNKRVDEAVTVLNKAAALLPKVAAVRLHQGMALLAAGQKGEAREALQAAVELGPGAEAEQATKMLESTK
ncbi:MAG: PEP-CTERM system TPR-repeat protein PrsT [Desulfuromonadaceae bacterium]